MTDGSSGGGDSPDAKKGLFSRFRKEQRAPESTAESPAQAGAGELPAAPAGGQEADEGAQQRRFARLRRVFSREPGGEGQEAPAHHQHSAPAAGGEPPAPASPESPGDAREPAPAPPREDAGGDPEVPASPSSAQDAARPAVAADATDAARGAVSQPAETPPPATEDHQRQEAEEKSRLARLREVFSRADSTPPPPDTAPAPAGETVAEQEAAGERRFGKIKRALERTGKGLGRVFLGKKQIDDDLLESLETQLLTADLGVEVTTEVIEALTDRVKRKELNDVGALHAALRTLLMEILLPCEKPLDVSGGKPYVVMTVGVNGVGKTTTIGKLARHFHSRGHSLMLAAGDTFRAAAVEQLQVWGERNAIPVVAQHSGADSASVIYDAFESARARHCDVLIADTAGRLHTKSNLMEELKKIKRVVAKLDPAAPHEVLLVLDAGTGQNAVNQLRQFHDTVGVTGIVLTKLDGTAKGGVIFALCRRFGIPIRYVGVGEGIDDLQPFRAAEFVDALLAEADSDTRLGARGEP